MTQLLVRHRVADFDRWKRVFDGHAAAQRAAGLRIERILRGVDDPQQVVLWFSVTDLAKARGFVTSPEVPDAQDDSGVLDEPDILFLH